jgi:hypothetical protein
METLVAQENHLFERTTREGEEELWGLRRLIPPPRPACRLKESGLVSERNVLDDVVFVSPKSGDGVGDGDGDGGDDGDLTEELNLEVDYSRWMQRVKEREQQQQQQHQQQQQQQQLQHQQQLSFSSEEDSNKKRSRSCEASTTRPEFETKELTNNATATSSGSRKRGKSKTETSHVISSGKKRKLNGGVAGAKGCPASEDLLPATKVGASTIDRVDSSNFVVLKECNVRARLLDIPPQILEQTTAVAKPSSSPLLPYQIARSLCRRGLPQVCVKYARIVPPPREAVLELLEHQQQAAADKGMSGKKRPGGPRSHPAVAKAAKTTERKTATGLVSCPVRKVEGNGLEALIPVRRDYLGMNNPFHMGSTEALRKARGLICNREG